MKLNKDICQEYLDILRQADEQWFYGYHWSLADQLKLDEALEFFESIRRTQLRKIVEEKN